MACHFMKVSEEEIVAISEAAFFIHLAPVVQTMDNAIHRINHYPLDNAIGFAITYPVDSDLSAG